MTVMTKVTTIITSIRRRHRAVIAMGCAILLAGSLTAACSTDSGTTTPPPAPQSDINTSNNIEQQFLKDQPIPNFNGHSDIRAELTQIEAIQALGEQTTTFMFNQGVRNPVAYCPSEGLPVPASAELSNPSTIFDDQNVGGGYNLNGGQSDVIPNMDPNGIYPGVTTGTYALCTDQAGGTYAFYWEGFDGAVSAPAVWNNATGQIQVTGAPKMPTCTYANTGTKKATVTCSK